MQKSTGLKWGPEELEEALKKERIMVVDDEEVITNVLSRFFPGQRLSIFGDPMEALASFKEMAGKRDPYTIVLTDIFMPVMDGLTLLRKIKEIEKAEKLRTRVVVMSGFGDREKVKGALDLGAAGFIDKPFLKKTLMDCLCRILQTTKTNI
ncbi:MAG: response regulator [Nitrospinae bacterium]|nr:response regulator [Nitrospinota bacterium]